MDGDEKFGSRVARLRRRRKLSQESLGERLNASQASISRLEASANPPGDIRLISQLAQALDVTVVDLLAGFEAPSGLAAAEPEAFYAFCPNPFCDRNKVGRQSTGTFVTWTSGQLYPPHAFDETNFCQRCGEQLVKNCPSCRRPLKKAGTRFCITCGTPVVKRPTQEEWQAIAKAHPEPGDSDDEDIPF